MYLSQAATNNSDAQIIVMEQMLAHIVSQCCEGRHPPPLQPHNFPTHFSDRQKLNALSRLPLSSSCSCFFSIGYFVKETENFHVQVLFWDWPISISPASKKLEFLWPFIAWVISMELTLSPLHIYLRVHSPHFSSLTFSL